ncbi:hypothetical protein B0H13DRAFT_1920987 [Mycena leptocephala]|nr:hypothetical protein B0H13DRAFT_1920987 [Mycena leptocephala]
MSIFRTNVKPSMKWRVKASTYHAPYSKKTVRKSHNTVMIRRVAQERGEEDDDGWETDETDGDEGEDVEVEELAEVIETIMLWKSSVLRLAWKWWKCHRVTIFTDTIWWKLWNFNGSQILLTPVGGGCGILAGHKFYGPQWKKSLLAPGLVLGGNGGMAEKVDLVVMLRTAFTEGRPGP